MPAHEHPIANSYSGMTDHGGSKQHIVSFYGYGTTYYLVSGYNGVVGGGQGHTHSLQSHTHTTTTMPPYLAVYMWKRVA